MVDEEALRGLLERYRHTRGQLHYRVSLWRVLTHANHPDWPADAVELQLTFALETGGTPHRLDLRGPADAFADHAHLLRRVQSNIDKILDGELLPRMKGLD